MFFFYCCSRCNCDDIVVVVDGTIFESHVEFNWSVDCEWNAYFTCRLWTCWLRTTVGYVSNESMYIEVIEQMNVTHNDLFLQFSSHLVVYYNCILIAAWVTLCLFIINCCIKEFAGKVEHFSGILKLSWLRLMLGMDVSSVSLL